MRAMFPQDAELFRWGPIPFCLYYGDVMYGLLQGFSRRYPGYGWKEGLVLLRGRRMIWIQDTAVIYVEGVHALYDLFLSDERRATGWKEWRAIRDEMRSLANQIVALDLAALSDDTFQRTFADFHELQYRFWMHSVLPELAGYGGEQVLLNDIRPHVPEQQLAEVMEALTAPREPSFFQREEFDLAETYDVSLHAKEYGWINNSYIQVGEAPVSFFLERRRTLSPRVRENFSSNVADHVSREKAYADRYDLPDRVLQIARAVRDGIIWQDERKEGTWHYLSAKDHLLNEVARRYGKHKDALLDAAGFEILACMQGAASWESIEGRKDLDGFIFQSYTDIQRLEPADVETYWDMYAEHKIDTPQDTIQGTVASKGKSAVVRGHVRIVLDPRKAASFEDGDILVAPMTSPDYVLLMRRSSAIVTDTGGLTSHAAIVSRELGVPCLVGTKIATQVLKDGDLVEVDAEKGIVRKL